MKGIGRVIASVAITGCLLVVIPANAAIIPYGSFNGTVINFDGLAGSPTLGAGEVLANQYIGRGVTFTVPNYNAYATNGILATGSSLTSLPNVIWVDQGGGSGGSLAQGMQIKFSTPQFQVGLYFALSHNSTATLAVYNGSTLLESVTSGLGPGGGVSLEGYLALQDLNITRAIVYSTNSSGQNWNFAVDNLKFNAVPEPTSIGLISIGLLAVAAGRRFKRSKVKSVPLAQQSSQIRSNCFFSQ